MNKRIRQALQLGMYSLVMGSVACQQGVSELSPVEMAGTGETALSGSESDMPATQSAESLDKQVAGEVPPELLNNIISDLSVKGNFDKEAISIIRAESAIWPDGSLGCPKPGEMYTHAQVKGYWVVLRSAGKKFDYRASSSGYFFRCTSTFKVQPPIG